MPPRLHAARVHGAAMSCERDCKRLFPPLDSSPGPMLGLSAWLPADAPPLFGVDRTAPAARFTAPLRTTRRERLALWLGRIWSLVKEGP